MWIAPQACGLFSRPLTPALLVPRKPFLSVNGTIRALALFAGFRVLDTGYPHAVQMPVQVQLAPARHMNFSLTSLANRARPLCMENRSCGSWRQDIKIARVKSAACTSGHSGPLPAPVWYWKTLTWRHHTMMSLRCPPSWFCSWFSAPSRSHWAYRYACSSWYLHMCCLRLFTAPTDTTWKPYKTTSLKAPRTYHEQEAA